MRVVFYERSTKGWLRKDLDQPEDRIEFEKLGVSITLAQIYDEIDFDA